jgi:hypothetical protein
LDHKGLNVHVEEVALPSLAVQKRRLLEGVLVFPFLFLFFRDDLRARGGCRGSRLRLLDVILEGQ